jgi:ABC-type Fe3+ transport system substrate-binding protein
MRYISGILFVLIACLPYVSIFRHDKEPQSKSSTRLPSETIFIISPHRREVRLEYSRGFAEWMLRKHNRRVNINWLDAGGTSKILKELESRYATSPDKPGVDLLFGGGMAPYYIAIEKNWLAPVTLPQEILDAIPAKCAGAPVYDPEHRWFGVALSSFGILYNKPLLARLNITAPRTWDDLARPDLLSWISSGDPRSSGTVHMSYEIILQAYGFERGWGLLTRILANVRNFGEGGAFAPREVATGDVAAGMVIDQYAETVINNIGRDALAFVLPEGLTIVGADSIALLRGAPSPALASLFIEYALSTDGQRILFQQEGTDGQLCSLHRLPVRKNLYDTSDAPTTRPYDFLGGFVYDDKKAMRRWNLVNDLIGVWLIDSHDDLVKAWKAVAASGMQPEMVAKLCTPPVPQDRIDTVAEQWNDPRQTRETIKQWAQGARTRYVEIMNLAKGTGGRQ